MFKRAVLGSAALALMVLYPLEGETFHLIKSLSGPSGKSIGAKFVLDETRSRFIYPQDKALIVFFEWQAPIGNHTLVASWKGPDGRVLSISPDVKVETKTADLNAYWEFIITPNSPSGIWTCEVRIDGEPAGSQSFEMVVPKVDRPVAPAEPEHPTMDQIYTKVTPSLVWVYAVDTDGARLDSSDGFVYAPNLVATSFEAIDSAAHLEIEFANGRRVKTDAVAACSRLQDWALLRVDTADVLPLPRGNPADVKIGERLPVYDVHANRVREFGGVDVSGRQTVPGAGPRIQFSPNLSLESSGGPLLDLDGKVVAILGASLTPGARFHHKDVSISPGLWNNLSSTSAAVPISVFPNPVPSETQTMSELLAGKVFTRPLEPGPSFLWGGISDILPKNPNAPPPDFKTEFRKNQQINVQMNWQKRDKNGKGFLSAEIFDAANRLLGNVPGKKVSLADNVPSRLAFSFSPATLIPGVYRIDVLWNDHAVWRTFFTIVE
jgi:hypothetical protein